MLPTNEFLLALPKAELHLHIEGTLGAARLLDRAERHGVVLPYETKDEVDAAYSFANLDEFLALYYRGCDVLRDAEDFYLLAKDYLDTCEVENIRHTEIGFDPQAHLVRGIALDEVMTGLSNAIAEARSARGQSVSLIMNFMRDRAPSEALQVLESADRWIEQIDAVGLDSAERDFPPALFAEVFAAAKDRGLRLTAHAGEEGPSGYVVSALEDLGAERIDHGVHAEDDPALVRELARRRTGLTMCPLSNVELKVVPDLAAHNVLRLLDAGVAVSVNSDDPAYFGGYLTANFVALRDALGMTRSQAVALARGAFETGFANPKDIERWLVEVEAFDQAWVRD